MPQGSPFWQGILFLIGLLFLAWEAWRGWRRGLIRSGINFAALVLSAVVATVAAKIVAAPFGGLTEISGFIPGAITGLILGLAVLLVMWLIGALAFKKTEHQRSGMVKLVWGSGGAFFGVLFGLVLLVGAISIVRLLGALGEAKVASAEAVRAVNPHSHLAKAPAIANQLAVLKESLEMGQTGKIVESVDVIPNDAYELIGGVTRLLTDQAALQRFLSCPGVEQAMSNPKLMELLEDPELLKAAQSSDFLSLMNNKNLRAAVDDPKLAEEIKKIDLRAALKYSLETPTPSPAPSHPFKSK